MRACIARKSETLSAAKAGARRRLAKARAAVLKVASNKRDQATQLAACRNELEGAQQVREGPGLRGATIGSPAACLPGCTAQHFPAGCCKPALALGDFAATIRSNLNTKQELRSALCSTALLKRQLAERSAAAGGGCPKPPQAAASSDSACAHGAARKRGGRGKGKGVGKGAVGSEAAPASKAAMSPSSSIMGATPSDSNEVSRHVSRSSSWGQQAKSGRTSSGGVSGRRGSRGPASGDASPQARPAQQPAQPKAWGSVQARSCQQNGWRLSFRDVVRGPDVFW